MTRPPPAFRRLLLLAVLLAVGVAAWWVLGDRSAAPKVGAGIDRPDDAPATDGSDLPALPAADPVLQGTVDAAPPAAGGPGEEPTLATWTLTFEVLDHDGTPKHWMGAGIHTRGGEILADAEADPLDQTRGSVEVPGSGLLVVGAFRRLPWVSEWLEPPTTGERHLVVHLQTGLRVAGMVYEQDGETPLAGGKLRAWIAKQEEPYRPAVHVQHGIVGQDGTFAIEGLPPGRVKLRAESHDPTAGHAREATVEVGDENVRLVLGPQGAIAFLIVDEATGFAPATRQWYVYEVTEDGERIWSHFSAREPEEGKEARPTSWYRGWLGRTHRFRVKAQGYETSRDIAVSVPDTGGKQLVRVELHKDPGAEARLRIRVRTADGSMPPWIPVTHHLGGGSSNTTGRKAMDGVVAVDLIPGSHHLSVGRRHRLDPDDPHSFWIPADLTLDVAAGEEREIEVFLERGGWALIDSEPDPDPRPREVTLTSGDQRMDRFVQWGPWGKDNQTAYHLGVLPEGTWTLEYAQRERGRRCTFEVERGKVTRLDATTFETYTPND